MDPARATGSSPEEDAEGVGHHVCDSVGVVVYGDGLPYKQTSRKIFWRGGGQSDTMLNAFSKEYVLIRQVRRPIPRGLETQNLRPVIAEKCTLPVGLCKCLSRPTGSIFASRRMATYYTGVSRVISVYRGARTQ